MARIHRSLEQLLGHPPRGRRRTPKRATDNPGPGNKPRPNVGGMSGERWREVRDLRPVPRTPEDGPGADGPRPAGRWSDRLFRGFRRPSLARRARTTWVARRSAP